MTDNSLVNAEKTAQGEIQIFPAERQLRITTLLQKHTTMRVGQLSEALQVSPMTIRRDLMTLEKDGVLDRTHGGAVYRTAPQNPSSKQRNRLGGRKSPFCSSWNKLTEAKDLQNGHEEINSRLGRKAAEMIQPQDSIFLHSGPIPPYILRHLDPDLPVRVYTNSLAIIGEAQNKNVELVFLGGEYQYDSHAFEGPLVMEGIRNVYPQKIFLTPDGYSPQQGITTESLWEAALERALLQQTRGEVIVLGHYDIFEAVANTLVAPAETASTLILDQKLPAENLQELQDLGVKVATATPLSVAPVNPQVLC